MTPRLPHAACPPLSRRLLLTLGAAALPVASIAAAAPAAHADPEVTDGRTRVLELPLGDAPTRHVTGIGTVRVLSGRATMIGCTWAASSPAVLRARGLDGDGQWSAWTDLEIAVDPVSGENALGSEAAWIGPVTQIEVQAQTAGGSDMAQDVTAHVVTTSPRSADAKPLPGVSGGRGSMLPAEAASATTGPELGPGAPTIIRRSQWGAKESLTSGVSTAAGIRSVVVHHTEGSNTYGRKDSPQILRGILSYHTQSLGWADIGYNVLIDKYGQVFEGRHGGLNLNVIGAHCLGYNNGTFGVSIMGSYKTSGPPTAARKALAHVIGWRLLGAFRTKVSEKSSFTVTSANVTHKKGSTISLPRIFAHRDVNYTDCPGNAFYAKMSAVRSDVQSWIDSSGWKTHVNAFTKAGGEAKLGTVTALASVESGVTVTRLTSGLVVTTKSGTAARVSPFASAWAPAWGRPLGDPVTKDGTVTQTFDHGRASRTGSAAAVFTKSASAAKPATPAKKTTVYSVDYAKTLYTVSGNKATVLSSAAYKKLGSPKTVKAPVKYVHYSWSPAVTAMHQWTSATSSRTWVHMTRTQFPFAGSPKPTVVDYIGDSTFYRFGTSSENLVRDSGGIRHRLTASQYSKAGKPKVTVLSNEGYVRLSWDRTKTVAHLTDVKKGKGAKVTAAQLKKAGGPTPKSVTRIAGDRVYYAGKSGKEIWYSGPTLTRRLTTAEWKKLGSPKPAAAAKK